MRNITTRKEQPLSLFNSWYIGGIAHELGHGIGLPHNNGTPEEKSWAGTSLMGGGNHTYRAEVWGGKNPSFLSQSCALRLVSSPRLTQSNKGRWGKPGDHIEQLSLGCNDDSDKMVITGNFTIPDFSLGKGEYTFKISAMHLNGAATTRRANLSIAQDGKPNIERFDKAVESSGK
ncbi:MAG: hypothetical protein ACI9TH_004291 [Kiritimatiellia bacterium]|jgi:hypothetical protein